MDAKELREQIIPAQPGWAVLSPSTDEKGHVELWEEPVIAWRIRVEEDQYHKGKRDFDFASADAITCEGFDEGSDRTALLRPDGKVVQPLVGAWDSKVEFLEFLRAELAKKAA